MNNEKDFEIIKLEIQSSKLGYFNLALALGFNKYDEPIMVIDNLPIFKNLTANLKKEDVSKLARVLRRLELRISENEAI